MKNRDIKLYPMIFMLDIGFIIIKAAKHIELRMKTSLMKEFLVTKR